MFEWLNSKSDLPCIMIFKRKNQPIKVHITDNNKISLFCLWLAIRINQLFPLVSFCCQQRPTNCRHRIFHNVLKKKQFSDFSVSGILHWLRVCHWTLTLESSLLLANNSSYSALIVEMCWLTQLMENYWIIKLHTSNQLSPPFQLISEFFFNKLFCHELLIFVFCKTCFVTTSSQREEMVTSVLS